MHQDSKTKFWFRSGNKHAPVRNNRNGHRKCSECASKRAARPRYLCITAVLDSGDRLYVFVLRSNHAARESMMTTSDRQWMISQIYLKYILYPCAIPQGVSNLCSCRWRRAVVVCGQVSCAVHILISDLIVAATVCSMVYITVTC